MLLVPSGNTKDSFSTHVIGVAGDISIVSTGYPSPQLEELQNLNKGKKFERPFDQANPMNLIGQLNLSTTNFEMFTAHLNDLMATNNFSKIKRRNLIVPFSLILLRQTHKILNASSTGMLNIICNDLNIEKCIMTLAYTDYVLIFNTLHFQKEALSILNTNTNDKTDSCAIPKGKDQIVMKDDAPEKLDKTLNKTVADDENKAGNAKNKILSVLSALKKTRFTKIKSDVDEIKRDTNISNVSEELSRIEANDKDPETESRNSFLDNTIENRTSELSITTNPEKVEKKEEKKGEILDEIDEEQRIEQRNDTEDFEEEDWMQQFNTNSYGIEFVTLMK